MSSWPSSIEQSTGHKKHHTKEKYDEFIKLSNSVYQTAPLKSENVTNRVGRNTHISDKGLISRTYKGTLVNLQETEKWAEDSHGRGYPKWPVYIYMKGAQPPQPLGDVPIKITKIYDSTPSKKSKQPKKGNMKCLQYLPELNPPDPMDPTSLLPDVLEPLSTSTSSPRDMH